MLLSTYADLYPGEILGTQLTNDGFDAIMSAGRAVSSDPQSSRLQRNIVKQNNDSLGRDVVVGT